MGESTLTKERLVDLLMPAMKQPIEQFAAQKSEAATKAESEIAEINKLKATLGQDSPAVAELNNAIKTLEHNPDTDRKARLRDAAIAVVTVCNGLGVPVEVKKPKANPGSANGTGGDAAEPAGRSSKNRRKRLSSAEIDRFGQLVLKALPPASTSDARCKSIEAISDDTGLSKDEVRSALNKLKREGDAETNGSRGPKGGWRKAAV
jgi:hypothetical protein